MRGTRLKATMVAGAATALLIGFGLPAQAALGSVGEVLSNNQVSATSVTYTSTLQVGVAAASVVVALPTTVTGLSAANVTVSTSTDGTTFTTVAIPAGSLLTSAVNGINKLGVNLPTALLAGNWVRVAITGLANPTSTGSINIGLADSLTALTQTTLDAITGPLTGLVSAALADVGTVVANIVAQATNGTTTNLAVAPVLSMSWGAASHSLSLTPGAGGTAIPATSDSITVSTNAQTYSIQAKLSNAGLLWQGGSAALPADLIPLTYSVNSAAPAAFGTSFAAVAPTLAGLTNSAVTTVNYGGSVDLTHPSGTYVGTVSYLVVPSF